MTALATLEHMVEQNDAKQEEAHKRLRADVREMDLRLDRYDVARGDILAKLATLETRPISKLTMTPGVVVSIVMICVSIAAGFYGSTYGLRSDMRDVLTRMELTAELERSNAKLQEQAIGQLRDSMVQMRQRTELMQLEVQSMQKTIAEIRPRR